MLDGSCVNVILAGIDRQGMDSSHTITFNSQVSDGSRIQLVAIAEVSSLDISVSPGLLKVGVKVQISSRATIGLVNRGHYATLLVLSDPLFKEVGLSFQADHVHPCPD
jgi:hypothetical protein